MSNTADINSNPPSSAPIGCMTEEEHDKSMEFGIYNEFI